MTLSPMMERVLARAPLTAQVIPKELVLSVNPMVILPVRFATLKALHDRGYITLFLRGKPRAKWWWRKI